MFESKIRRHESACWLVNTGWVGGKFGVGTRISLAHTQEIINAIHSGVLSTQDRTSSNEQSSGSVEWENYSIFNLAIPTSIPDSSVPSSILNPSLAWHDEDAFDRERLKLAGLFRKAFRMFEHDDNISAEVKVAGPDVD